MKILRFFFPTVGVFVMLIFGWNHLNLGLWHDEAFSIKKFVLHDFLHTATYYPEPNNHIFFNLFNNLITRLIGARDFHDLLDYIIILRSVQGLIALITLFYVFRLAKKFINLETAWIASIVFVTTVPFLNYATQLRGYNFSMLFVTMSLFYVNSYLLEMKKRYLGLMAISLFLLVYTMPSNIYFFTALMLVFGLNWFFIFIKNKGQNLSSRFYKGENKNYWNLLWAGAGSLLLIVLAYTPVISSMMQDRYLNRAPDDRFFTLFVRLPNYVGGAISGRNALILLSLLAMIYIWRIENFKMYIQKWFWLLFLFFMPFVFSFLQNNFPLARTFVHLTPIFSLLVAIPIGICVKHLDVNQIVRLSAITSIYVYCIFSLSSEFNNIQNQLSENLKKGIRAQDNYLAYYQSKTYDPNSTALQILKHYKVNPYPVVMSPRELDAITLSDYLNKYKIKNYFLKKIRPFNTSPNKRNLKVLISNSNLGEEQSILQNETIHFTKKMQQSSFRTGRFAALVDFMNSKENVDNFYVVASFNKLFWKKFASFYEDEYKIKQLNKEESSFNIYLFSKIK